MSEFERQLRRIVRTDTWFSEILEAVAAIALPDWAVGGGVLRSLVWDRLHGYSQRTLVP